MRNKCQMKWCEDTNIAVKVHEDWEDVIYGICWSCGDNLNEILGYELMTDYQFVLKLVRENVRD